MASKYMLFLSDKAKQAIGDIYNYISHVLLNEPAAKKTVSQIISGLDQLLLFPELGFNADERYGKQIHPDFTTRALVISKYIAFYFVDEEKQTIFSSHLFSSKSDYVKLL